MRSVYESTYKQGRGYTPTDWWSAVARRGAGRAAHPVCRCSSAVRRGARPVPMGYGAPPGRSPHGPGHDARRAARRLTATDSAGGVRVMYVAPHSAADTAGIKAGDLVTQLGDIAVRDNRRPGVSSPLRERQRHHDLGDGGARPVDARRGRGTPETLTVQVPVRSSLETTTRIEADPNASPKLPASATAF